MKTILFNTLALLTLINPISKVFVVSLLSEKADNKAINRVALRSSIAAAAILIVFTLSGTFIFSKILHVDIYSLKIVGGVILILRGFQALTRGIFFETELQQKIEDLSIVPLASPMIAGPAAIAAAVSFPSQYGLTATIIPLLIAISINFGFMLCSARIAKFLHKCNLFGTLIRITGLVVATIGMQMILNGGFEYVQTYF